MAATQFSPDIVGSPRMPAADQDDLLAGIEPLLVRPTNDPRPVVLMTCGLAGAGKTTLSKAVLALLPQFHRLSIDEIIFKRHGLYGVDYPPDMELYQKHMEEAGQVYLDELHRLLRLGQDVILDRSFYAKEDRDHFRRIVQAGGARLVLVFLAARDREKLWKRICDRSAKGKDANSALDITRGIFDMYWGGFEEPVGEGEIVIQAI